MKMKDVTESAGIAVQSYLPYLSAVLDPFLQKYPIWQAVFYSAIGLWRIHGLQSEEVKSGV